MPAASKQQQKLMGIVRAIQKGDMKPSGASKKAQQMAKSMKPGDVKKYASTKHKGLPKKVKKLKKEGIHDKDITSASHTNVKTPQGGDYNPKDRADNLKKLAAFGPKGKKDKKEEGVLEQVYAVQKPYSGCQLTSLVKPIDPLKGLEGSEVMPDAVHGVYQDQEQAQAVAQGLYEEYMDHRKTIEEKKVKVVEKIKKVMNALEKKRKDNTDMIKENPKEASKYKQTVAELTHKLDELITTLERVEMSKENLEEEDHDKKKDKEDLKEALRKLFEKKKEFTFKKAGKKSEEGTVKAETLEKAKKEAYEKGGDPKTVKEKKEEKNKDHKKQGLQEAADNEYQYMDNYQLLDVLNSIYKVYSNEDFAETEPKFLEAADHIKQAIDIITSRSAN
jgi:DNA repair exonuclease SbcCD ATPase subunit